MNNYNNFLTKEESYGEQIANDLKAYNSVEPAVLSPIAKSLIALVAVSIVGFVGYKMLKK